ncbi:EAL domain-containing protein [Pseudovibrio sp. Tun.PSC04-5.I4]|uniref:putative bifunctional diguanylate cyclase/phosphodiesterase n=1 Tax=Pseudovibrio sp. Tun.PSC04-5.I4 TaxID=1798213 RepID=UPI00088319F2|nr:EAL domain-containing protein [Pseudovibrio sp. Tun.PSC04-5.I4]SDR21305.1 diguanylate cyclase (GGDEF) domain-containing protein [Pseudovibrio sp. Tun.PSC04-5.I4]
MRRVRHSISLKLAIISVVAIALSYFALTFLVIIQWERTLQLQSEQLSQIAVNQFSTALERDVALVKHRIQSQLSETAASLSAIGERSDIVKAAETRVWAGDVNILSLVQEGTPLDAIILLNYRGQIVGASKKGDPGLIQKQLLKVHLKQALRTTWMPETGKGPVVRYTLLPATQFGPLLPGEPDAGVSQILYSPLVDPNTQWRGALVAQRWFPFHSGVIDEYSRISGAEIAIFYQDKLVGASPKAPVEALRKPEDLRKLKILNTAFEFCDNGPAPLVICAFKPLEVLLHAQERLRNVGEESSSQTFQRLIVLGFAACLIIFIVALLVSRKISQPLQTIADALSDVAGGNFDVRVEGTRRMDEVGEIARAVKVLQASARERDSLRLNIQRKNKELRNQEQELVKQNTLFDAALNNMSHGLCMFDTYKRLIVFNQRFDDIFACEQGAGKIGMTWNEMLTCMPLAQEFLEETGEKSVAQQLWPSTVRSTFTLELQSEQVILMTLEPQGSGGWVAIFEDITERQRISDHLSYLATHDTLTKLPNRLLMNERLQEMKQAALAQSESFGILWMDLDEFKTINDSLGHTVGDKLLCHIARILREKVTNKEMIARLGGDEFAILSKLPASREDLEKIAQEVLKIVAAPCFLEGHEIVVGASLGIAMFSKEQQDVDELIRFADLALYQAKNDGRNTYRFFESDMAAKIKQRQTLITDLYKATANRDLEVYFQPQVILETGEISGFEALLRWNHPRYGFISPFEFIPLAEETGLILEIGAWVLDEACSLAAGWPKCVNLAVNLSPRQIYYDTLLPVVDEVLARTGLDPGRLELEVTETVLLADHLRVRQTLAKLQQIGVKISMDDFGTGYSSLSTLRRFPFDRIKVDRSFVMSMDQDEDARFIVNSVIELANRLGIATTAEGVESKEIAEQLKAVGCTEAQGYYFGKPAPPNQALFWLLEEARGISLEDQVNKSKLTKKAAG